MDPSTELKEAVLRLYEGLSQGEAGLAERLFSHQEGVLAIGSDASEWWADFDMIDQGFRAQLRGMRTQPIVPGDLQAFVEGTVGWTADRRTLRLANGQELTIRETAVFHREGGEWRIVQLHASLAIPNAEVFGDSRAGPVADPSRIATRQLLFKLEKTEQKTDQRQ